MKTITVRAADTRGWLAVIITKTTTVKNTNNKENIIPIPKITMKTITVRAADTRGWLADA